MRVQAVLAAAGRACNPPLSGADCTPAAVRRGVNAYTEWDGIRTALMMSVAFNEVGRFDALMAYEHTDLDAAVAKGGWESGQTALHYAARANRPELAARLLADPRFTRWGAEAEFGDGKMRTALAMAKRRGKSAAAAAIEAGIAARTGR
eukprot:SAG11_NODE_959_length_6385_cov_30.010181_4_plen_149_part_00